MQVFATRFRSSRLCSRINRGAPDCNWRCVLRLIVVAFRFADQAGCRRRSTPVQLDPHALARPPAPVASPVRNPPTTRDDRRENRSSSASRPSGNAAMNSRDVPAIAATARLDRAAGVDRHESAARQSVYERCERWPDSGCFTTKAPYRSSASTSSVTCSTTVTEIVAAERRADRRRM